MTYDNNIGGSTAKDAAVKPHDGNDGGTAAGLYSTLEEYRRPYLDRARECAEVTIPYLVPPEGFNHTSKLYTPFQGVGARGVNNLASKLLLTLFPPNSPFYRFRIDEYAVEVESDVPAKTKIEQGLAKMERGILVEIETSAMRVPAFEALKHLIVAGNILVYLDDDNKMRAYHLDRYVCRRDPMGTLLEIIVREELAPAVLPELFEEDFLVQLQDQKQPSGYDKTCYLYTHVKRCEGQWEVYQEVKGLEVPGSRGTYPLDNSPWFALRFARIDGEDYGRGYVEEYLGDLKSLEGLAQAIVEGSVAAAKVLFLVHPNGTTRKSDLQKANNGDFVEGNAEEVTTLQLEKYSDFRFTAETAKEIEQRLAHAFLLNSAIQRQAERVTAEEIRYMAGELEDALGGIYSILSSDWQYPLINRIKFQMQKDGRLPQLPEGVVRLSITAGLEALGRGHDMNKLTLFLKTLQETVGPEAVQKYVNVSDVAGRLVTALGIDTTGLIHSDQVLAQQEQAAQLQALIAKLGPNAINQVGGLAKEVTAQNGFDADGARNLAAAAAQYVQPQR